METENKNIRYFAVVYCYDGTVHLAPGSTQEECLERLRDMKLNPKTIERMEATTVIKRDMNNFKDDKIFGCPKSLNVMLEKARKRAR